MKLDTLANFATFLVLLGPLVNLVAASVLQCAMLKIVTIYSDVFINRQMKVSQVLIDEDLEKIINLVDNEGNDAIVKFKKIKYIDQKLHNCSEHTNKLA